MDRSSRKEAQRTLWQVLREERQDPSSSRKRRSSFLQALSFFIEALSVDPERHRWLKKAHSSDSQVHS
jgi:hypothetical protein